MFGKVFARIVIGAACVLAAGAAFAQGASSALDQTVDRITARERENMRVLEQHTPIVETYIQDFKNDREMGQAPVSDHYFLGRVSFKGTVRDDSYLRAEKKRFFASLFSRLRPRGEFLPLGFAQMAIIDGNGFDREHYSFRLLDRDFLGEVRTLIFEVVPKPHAGVGRFVGRIWVEDQNYNIVRANGVYSTEHKGPSPYLHFDLWRLNLQPGVWLPAYIYTEEDHSKHIGVANATAFRAQTRLWGYRNTQRDLREFTQVLVDVDAAIRDQSERPQGYSPVAAERFWQREAEDNVLGRLERAYLLAPSGEVDKVLRTVLNNLIFTNNITLDPEARCRVLLTAPLESFSVGHSIVISRGLLDVLPDEITLAFVLAHELAHIVLDHRLEPKYAFADRTIFSDEQTLQKLSLSHGPAQEAAADQKALELLRNSPYASGLTSVGLFLRQMQRSSKTLPNLISARLGNTVMTDAKSSGVAELTSVAPPLEQRRTLTPVAALPLGGRIKMDPWTSQIEMSKARPVPLLKPRENKPFEITPIIPYLSRLPDANSNGGPLPAKPATAKGAQ